jgi:hypothetical protein
MKEYTPLEFEKMAKESLDELHEHSYLCDTEHEEDIFETAWITGFRTCTQQYINTNKELTAENERLKLVLTDICNHLTGDQEAEDELEKGLGIRLASLVQIAKKLLNQ